MGIFDFFRKKTEATKTPETLDLETLLQKASGEPAYRAEFYQRLLTEKLVVVTDRTHLAEGEQTLQEDTQVNIASYPDGKIPVFTSQERIFDHGIVKEKVHVLTMEGRALFELTKGATFMLNPNSDYSKELLPEEIEHLLNGTILKENHKQIHFEKETDVRIGQPAVYPTDAVESLKSLFAMRPQVKAAYLAWIYNPSSGEPPHYIFGLDGEGDLQSVTSEAGYTIQQSLRTDQIVDFLRIDGTSGLDDYFLEHTTPFYIRQGAHPR